MDVCLAMKGSRRHMPGSKSQGKTAQRVKWRAVPDCREKREGQRIWRLGRGNT